MWFSVGSIDRPHRIREEPPDFPPLGKWHNEVGSSMGHFWTYQFWKWICTGWWLGHPSEKYESQLGWLFPIYIYIYVWENKTCSKPPTRLIHFFEAIRSHRRLPAYAVFLGRFIGKMRNTYRGMQTWTNKIWNMRSPTFLAPTNFPNLNSPLLKKNTFWERLSSPKVDGRTGNIQLNHQTINNT